MSDTHDTFHKKMVEDVTPKSMRQFACFCDLAPREQIRLYADAIAATQAEIAALWVSTANWRSYELSKNQANKECGK